MDATEQQIPYTHEFVVDAEYQRSLARGIFAASFRPIFWISVALVALGSGLLAVSGDRALVTFFIVWIALMGVFLGLRFARTRVALNRAFPIGTVLRSGFGSTQFVITNGSDTSRMSYSGFDRPERRGDLVWVRRTQLPRRVVYAGALFSDSELARLGSATAPSSADSLRPRPGTPA